MYHNPNLPYPFSSRTCGRPMNQRPLPETDCTNNPINPPDCKESPSCREQPICREKPICQEKPVCREQHSHREQPTYREKPSCREQSIFRGEPIQEKTCQPQPLKNTCIEPLRQSSGEANAILCTSSCNTSRCNGNQLPILLVMLYLFKII